MHDVVIVGAGVAGMTAALYALRANKSVLVLEQESVGGQAALSPRIENYPSVKQISGSELTESLLDQILALGAEVELEKVERIEKKPAGFSVVTDYGIREALSVILATGARHKKIGVDGEDELVGNGVSYCAVCDGAFFAGEEVALIGDANTALQYAVSLSDLCKKVYVCTLFDRFFGEQKLVDTLRTRDNVVIRHNVSLRELVGRPSLRQVVFADTTDGSEYRLEVSACFICIGQEPDNEAFRPLVQLDGRGYIAAGEDCKTSCEGVFAAGDCRTKSVRQITTAAADGAVAAVAACAYLASKA